MAERPTLIPTRYPCHRGPVRLGDELEEGQTFDRKCSWCHKRYTVTLVASPYMAAKLGRPTLAARWDPK